MTLDRRTVLKQLAASGVGAGAAILGLQARAANKPAIVRIGVAQPGIGNPPQFSGSSAAVANAKGWVEEEFKADGIKVEWFFFKGAGPAVNEALSNKQLDFAFQGDLPSIVAKSAGLKTRLILATGVRSNIYLAVPPDSPIQSVKDLRGKRVAIFKGTNAQLPINRVLEANSLQERDLRAINLDQATTLAALSTKDIDAAFGNINLLRLRDKNAARIVYSSKGGSPIFTTQSHVLVTDEFAQQYPQITARVVKTFVKTSKWASDEVNREEVLRLWAKAGTPYEHWREDYDGEPLRVRINPNFDPFLVARYKDSVEQAYRLKLSRSRFDVDQWIDQRYLKAALKELNLETYWPIFQVNGKILGT
ncbi:nitrate ABC transporter substrate-binding protein [Herbaspirillum hiltneri N3]|uniref:Nitrate ABC transporter substrate-binding protein n=1 Tax=Herbaspirillum hiltneri N3 TaxID=1262470 RepID=A0ABM5V222_9BURK|nr:ABC transporter substrate-binding protein [Herbaspirillum hiltneri]AKZ63520.1 nitrate ABC transporter substrate-binding protein [Herbaspirillum hiltneri N3]